LGGGSWFSSNPPVATIDPVTSVVTGVSLGTSTIVYTAAAGSCFVTQMITVNPLPLAFNVTGGGSHCSSDTGVHIRLSGSSTGVNYMVYLGSTAVGSISGTGALLDLGLYTVAG